MADHKLPLANKNLGQHFLKDKHVIDKICTNFSNQNCGIIEVGPGPGILTQHLMSHNKTFHVIEMDARMHEYLLQFLPAENIHIEDALKIELPDFITKYFEEQHIWLVSNLPYNVGVPLLINFLQAKQIGFMTLMFQKEVGEKITPLNPKEKNVMNSLMALTNNYFKTEVVCKVLPGAFIPPPKVDSIVLSLTRIPSPIIPLNEFHDYESFLRKLFSMKRKQIGKVLKTYYNPEQVERGLATVGLDKTLRAETLTLDQVRLLFRSFKG